MSVYREPPPSERPFYDYAAELERRRFDAWGDSFASIHTVIVAIVVFAVLLIAAR